MVPAGVDRLKRAVRRISLLIIVATPAGNRPVGPNPAGIPPPGRDLLKLRVGRDILLSLIIRPPTHSLPVLA